MGNLRIGAFDGMFDLGKSPLLLNSGGASLDCYPDHSQVNCYVCQVKDKPFKITTWPTTVPLSFFSVRAIHPREQ